MHEAGTGRRRHGWLLLCLTLVAAPAAGHEFWVAPESARLAPGEDIIAGLMVGQEFSGTPYPYLSHGFRAFTVRTGGTTRPVEGHEGDLPAVRIPEAEAGLRVIAYHSVPYRLAFEAWAAFVEAVEYEGNGWAARAHRARGLPEAGFVEHYVRCAKALVQVGPPVAGEGDRAVGLPLELVAGANPYAAEGTLPVRLLWQGAPLADTQVSVFRKAGGEVSRQVLRTDRTGRVTVSLEGGGAFLLNAVHMRPAPAASEAAWESFWASLTFALPEGR